MLRLLILLSFILIDHTLSNAIWLQNRLAPIIDSSLACKALKSTWLNSLFLKLRYQISLDMNIFKLRWGQSLGFRWFAFRGICLWLSTAGKISLRLSYFFYCIGLSAWVFECISYLWWLLNSYNFILSFIIWSMYYNLCIFIDLLNFILRLGFVCRLTILNLCISIFFCFFLCLAIFILIT